MEKDTELCVLGTRKYSMDVSCVSPEEVEGKQEGDEII